MEKRKQKTEAELADEEKQRITEKADKKYVEWLESKQNELKEKQRLEREKKREQKMKEEEKQKKCQAAYEKWLKDSKSKPKTVPNSFGYASGKLTGN